MIFDQGSQVGKQHIDEKFLKNRNCSSTREFLHVKAAFQLLIFGFDWPAIKIKFLKHYLRDGWIEKVGSEIFFRAVIKRTSMTRTSMSAVPSLELPGIGE